MLLSQLSIQFRTRSKETQHTATAVGSVELVHVLAIAGIQRQSLLIYPNNGAFHLTRERQGVEVSSLQLRLVVRVLLPKFTYAKAVVLEDVAEIVHVLGAGKADYNHGHCSSR